MKNVYLIATVRDNASETLMDQLESAARGQIVSHGDDGCGRMKLVIRPNVRPAKKAMTEVLEAVAPLSQSARWVQSGT